MANSRQWYHRANIPVPDTSSASLLAKSLIWLEKAALKDEVTTGTLGPEGPPPSSAAWACEGSSDSTTAGMDGNDRWTAAFAASRIVRATAGNPHSWRVDSKTISGVKYYRCVDWSSAADTLIKIYAAKNPFTGGSITDRPTAVGEFQLTGADIQFNNGTVAPHVFHKVVDAQGNYYLGAGRVSSGYPINYVQAAARLTGTRGADLNDFFMSYAAGFNTPGPSLATFVGNVIGLVYDGSALASGGIVYPYAGNTTAPVNANIMTNPIDGSNDVDEAVVWTTNNNKSGRRGVWPDLGIAWGTFPVGAGEPTAGAMQRALWGGNLLVPSSVPMQT